MWKFSVGTLTYFFAHSTRITKQIHDARKKRARLHSSNLLPFHAHISTDGGARVIFTPMKNCFDTNLAA